MTYDTDPLDRDDELDEEVVEDDEFERAPQPGNTPSPDDPPYDPGAITSPETLDPDEY